MYTAAMFGMNETTLPEVINTVPEDIYNLIDEFRGKNDGVFRETGYIKPYSRLLDEMADFLPAVFFVFSIALILRTLPKVESKIGSILSLLYVIVSTIGIGLVALIAHESPLFVENNRNEKFPEMLLIKNPQGKEFPENDKEFISITKQFIRRNGIVIEVGTHYRPLSDMRPKNRAPLNHVLQVGCPLGRQNLGKNEPSVFFKLEEDGKINAYLSGDYPKLENKLHSLPTPEKVTSFALFKKGKVMVTSSKRGIIQWESENNKRLHKIMSSTEVAQYNQNSD